jgi:Uma2 family endonuclease
MNPTASELMGPQDFPDFNEFVIEDGKPVDSILAEKQMRLLTEPLYSSWSDPPNGQPFVAMANVGVFYSRREPPLVPDVFLAVGVTPGNDLTRRENLSYFMWLRGKAPDVVIEVVSKPEGGEDTSKKKDYARIGVPYYVIFDPANFLGGGRLRVLEQKKRNFEPLPVPWFFPDIGLGVCLWQGRFEDYELTWLRWCDREGKIILTGKERAEQAIQEIKRLRQLLREKGLEQPP